MRGEEARGSAVVPRGDTLSKIVERWVGRGRKSGPTRRRYNDFP